jgi:simple sugar transport system substrate-binding protein
VSASQGERDPRAREVSRRRFLRNAGVVGLAVPALSTILEACGSAKSGSASGSGTSSFGGQGKDPFASHPTYHFTLVNHVTTNPFFVATRYGAQDACNLLNCTYDWVGSATSDVSQMVSAFDAAISAKVDGIGCPLIDPTAFNAPTEQALNAGIPVIAYNTNTPAGSGNKALAYIGQDLTLSGQEAGKQILKYVSKGDLVAGMIATPGSLNLQPRMDGASGVLKPAGIDFVTVATGATTGQELNAVSAWYDGHQDVKFMYAVDDGSGIAVGQTIKKSGGGKVKGSSFDMSSPIPQYVQSGLLEFTIDQQPYLQGFLPILQLFLYQISGGLSAPVDTNTGLTFVTKTNVGPYVASTDRYEGSSSAEKIIKAPGKVAI